MEINDLETTGDNTLSFTVDATDIKLSADAEVSMFGKKVSWDADAKVDAKVEVTGTYRTEGVLNACITLDSLKAKVVTLEPHITVEYTGLLGTLISKWQSTIQTKIVQLLQGKITSAVADWIESLGGEGSSEITMDDFDGERQEFDGMKMLEYFGVDINELTGYKCAEAMKQESMKQARKFDARLSVLEQRLHELERA